MIRINALEQQHMKKKVPQFAVGDTVAVHVKVVEGERERTQIFQGTVIRRRGSGTRETFTVRRIAFGEGVERVFPLHAPMLLDVQVIAHGKVRRAKLYYLRGRVGKHARVKVRAYATKASIAEEEEAQADEPPAEEEVKAAGEKIEEQAAEEVEAAGEEIEEQASQEVEAAGKGDSSQEDSESAKTEE